MPQSFTDRFGSISYLQLAMLAATVAFLLYLPTLHFEFVNWDDDRYVTENPALSYPWWDFLRWASTTFRLGNWHPLTWVSLKLDHAIWGLNPLGYHLSNIILHAANTYLVVILMWQLLGIAARDVKTARRLGFAFAIGIVFAVHPLHVESVAWVSERKDLLFALFYLLSALSWIQWVKEPENSRSSLFFFSLLFYALSLMSKPMAVSLPIVLLLLDIYPLRRFRLKLRLVIEKLPLIVLTLIAATITLVAQSEAVASIGDWSLSDRFGTAARAFFFYVYKALFPVALSPLYQLRVVDDNLLRGGVAAGLGFLTILALALVRVKKKPVYFVLLATFVVMVLPILGIVQVGSQFAADRYMYVPILPLAVGGCILLNGLVKKLHLSATWYVPLVSVSGILLCLLTYQQMLHWRNSELLWKKVLAEDFEVATAHYNLGNYYLSIGRLDQAEPEWLAAIRLDPKHSMAHNQLGNLRVLRGELNSALENYGQAVENDPDNIEAVFNYAQVLDRLGMIYGAREFYRRFVELATAEYRAQAELASSRISQIDAAESP